MGIHVTDPFVEDALRAVLKPVEEANGLPNGFYVDEALHARERQALFFDGWAAMGFAHDVAAPGDACPVDYLGMPLLMVRDRGGAVRVFQNTCRHRGMVLVTEPTKLRGMIRCPYHSWCYDLEGRLRSTPHVGGPGQNLHEAVDRDTLGLAELRAHVWQGVVFVNVSGKAAPFEEWAAPMLARWAEFEQPSFAGGADSAFDLEVACNWKLAVENYCESYHLPWVHPGLNSYSRLEDHYHVMDASGTFSGQGTTVYDPKLSETQAFADYAGLSQRWARQAEYIALYPNVLLGVHRDHRFAIVLLPRGPERTVERVAISYADEAAAGPDFAELRARNTSLWKEVFEEDIFVVEGMQKGRHGPLFDGGRFSPAMDEPTHAFHRWAAARFLGEDLSV